jgi:hypothetical protein
MIIVFAELGGRKLLGKARELADASGDRVLALARQDNERDPQSLVHLGADEVLTCKVGETSGMAWMSIFLELMKKETVRLVMLPSDLLCNEVLGGLSYALGQKGTVMDDVELLEATSASKSFKDLSVALRRVIPESKVALFSVKLSSVPEPFEDSSRYGKISSMELHSQVGGLSELDTEDLQSSDVLSILLGSDDPKLNELANRLGEKWDAPVRQMSGKIEVVYGPCLAVEVKSRLNDLPEFKGSLFAINSTKAPITSIADAASVTSEIEKVLELML